MFDAPFLLLPPGLASRGAWVPLGGRQATKLRENTLPSCFPGAV